MRAGLRKCKYTKPDLSTLRVVLVVPPFATNVSFAPSFCIPNVLGKIYYPPYERPSSETLADNVRSFCLQHGNHNINTVILEP